MSQGFSPSAVHLLTFCSPCCLLAPVHLPTLSKSCSHYLEPYAILRICVNLTSYIAFSYLCSQAPTTVCITIMTPNVICLAIKLPVLCLFPHYTPLPGFRDITLILIWHSYYYCWILPVFNI